MAATYHGRMKTAALVFALAAAGCAHPIPLSGSMEAPVALAAAESAFAAHSLRADMRAAFLANFADDGVFVRKGWVNANADLAPRQAPPIVLDWRPVYVETALAGDLGLSTGPWKLTGKPASADAPRYGQFVSIWKREGRGPWKVAVDLGISHPQSALWEQPLETTAVRNAGTALAGGIGTAEARFARSARYDGARAAYRKDGAANLRFYRDGAPPVLGLAPALAAPSMVDARSVFTLEGVETARSGDFGYARGSYADASAPAVTLGYFMRVWRMEAGEWKIALDVTNSAKE